MFRTFEGHELRAGEVTLLGLGFGIPGKSFSVSYGKGRNLPTAKQGSWLGGRRACCCEASVVDHVFAHSFIANSG